MKYLVLLSRLLKTELEILSWDAPTMVRAYLKTTCTAGAQTKDGDNRRGLRNPGEGEKARWSESHYLIRQHSILKDFPEKQGINWLISVYSFSALKFKLGKNDFLNPYSFLFLDLKIFLNKHLKIMFTYKTLSIVNKFF